MEWIRLPLCYCLLVDIADRFLSSQQGMLSTYNLHGRVGDVLDSLMPPQHKVSEV